MWSPDWLKMKKMTERRPYTDKETLKHLYCDKEYTQTYIAKRLGCSRGTVRNWLNKHGIERRPQGLEKPPTLSMMPNGRERFVSNFDGRQDSVLHHRLIAVAEHGYDAVCETVVHHKNNIPWDNRPSNLELLTRKEHQRHHYREGDVPSKLSGEEVREIRQRYDTGEPLKDIVTDYDLHDQQLRYIARRESYAWVRE